jgi:putative hydrolase of the HAD superfamily
MRGFAVMLDAAVIGSAPLRITGKVRRGCHLLVAAHKRIPAKLAECESAVVQALDSIQAISLDVGGTMIEPWPSVGHVYAAVAAENGYPGIPPATLNRHFGDAWRRKRGFDHSRPAWRALVQETFTDLLPPEAAGALLGELYRRFACASAWRVFDDVVPVLRDLKERGFRLVVLSNWDERLRPLLEELELASWFERIVVSCEVGVAKPSARIFQRCAEELDLPLSAILHVGDSRAEDLEGARQAGMRARLIDRRQPAEGETEPKPWDQALAGLPAFIGRGN